MESSPFLDILDEWEGGSYYSDEFLAEGYTQLLLLLLGASPEERADPRFIPFIEAGGGSFYATPSLPGSY